MNTAYILTYNLKVEIAGNFDRIYKSKNNNPVYLFFT